MTSFATDARNDIYLDAAGNLAMVAGLDAVKQDCEHVMKAQVGEMPLALDQGVPTLTTIWANWRPAQFEAYARKMLLSVPNVVAVKTFTLTRAAGVASYVAEIQTVFSDQPLALSGNLVQP